MAALLKCALVALVGASLVWSAKANDWEDQLEALKESAEWSQRVLEQAEQQQHVLKALALLSKAANLNRVTIPAMVNASPSAYGPKGPIVRQKNRVSALRSTGAKIKTEGNELYRVTARMISALAQIQQGIQDKDKVGRVSTSAQLQRAEQGVELAFGGASKIAPISRELVQKMASLEAKIDLYHDISGVPKGGASSSSG